MQAVIVFLHLHISALQTFKLDLLSFGLYMNGINLQVFKIVVTQVFAESYKILKAGLEMRGERLSRCCVSEKPLSVVFLAI